MVIKHVIVCKYIENIVYSSYIQVFCLKTDIFLTKKSHCDNFQLNKAV